MKVKPIQFSTSMVKAILAGNKTVTRRVIKPQPKNSYGRWTWTSHYISFNTLDVSIFSDHAPYQPGDILWVREPWRVGAWHLEKPAVAVDYKADGYIRREWLEVPDDLYRRLVEDSFVDARHAGLSILPDDLVSWKPGTAPTKWRSPRFMPKKAARLFLEVLSIHPERLQDAFSAPISPIFALLEEGMDIGDTCRHCIDSYGEPCCVDTVDEDGGNRHGGECGVLDENRSAFADLWDTPNKKRDFGWNTNPWVWRIAFRRCEKPEEFLPKGGNFR